MFSSFPKRKYVRQTALRLLVLTLGALFITSAWPPVQQAKLQSSEQQNAKQKTYKPESVPGEILIRFRLETVKAKDQAARTEMSVQAGGRAIALQVERLGETDVVEGLRLAHVAPEETAQAISALNARPDVLYAEPNYIRRASKTPNDSRYAQMWNLKNTGQPDGGGHPGVPGADIDAEPAWDITTGSKSVVVGVIDEGIDINHQDLQANIWTNPAEIPNNGVDDDGNGYVDDVNGWDFAHNDSTVFDYTGATYPPSANYTGDVEDHGTHVAGTIGAAGNNSTGVVGINWQVSLMSLKFLTGIDGEGSTADLLKAFSYARMMRELWQSSGGTKGANIRVLNNSYGGGGFSQAEYDAIHALSDSSILFVVASGNEGAWNDRSPTYPSGYALPNVISVAASDRNDLRASFSNTGAATVSMAAPGEGILSTTPKNTYEFFDGTSMSSPHVAGAAALLCAASPDINMRRLRAALMYSGDILNSQNFYTLLASGRRLNVANALQNLQSTDATAPAAVGNLNFTNNYPTFRLQWTAPGDDGTSGTAAVYEIRFSESELSSPAQFELARPLAAPLPSAGGSFQSADVQIPWRHPNGFIGIRAVDEVGNAGPISTVPVSVSTSVADPYIVTESAASPLSTGGTPLGLVGDDMLKGYGTPFPFTFFGKNRPVYGFYVSTNGAIYFGNTYPSPDDSFSSVSGLTGLQMIAGMWDDLRTDRRAGDDVYVVTPDADRIIFRWQAVTYDSLIAPGVSRGENPVNFEIELRSDGTIIKRYGSGNQKLHPVVGISAGWSDPYLISSHTAGESLIDLTNAPTVTYTLRDPTPPPTADFRISITSTPELARSGGQITYTIRADNDSYTAPPSATITDQLPAGTTFVSCSGSCSGPPVGTNGTVTSTLSPFPSSNGFFGVTITVQVTAPPGTTLRNTASVSSPWRDPNPANNSATDVIDVVQNAVFGSVSAVAAGQSHTLALRTDGTVWAWGANGYGQLGDGSTFESTTPVPVSNLTNVTALAAGEFHSLALLSDGTVWSWGNSNSGQLGIGELGEKHAPVQVPGLTNVKAIAAGRQHSIALKTDGTVWAWGYNGAGQVGDGSQVINKLSPVQVVGLSGVVAIAGGQYHSLAVKSDGTVWAWGYNNAGQCVPGGTPTYVLTPTQVNGLTDISSVAADNDFSIALKRNGTVWAWGANDYGTLGNGTTNRQTTVVQVSNLSNVTAIDTGGSFSFALKSDGTIWGWGRNFGWLGNGTTTEYSAVPLQVSDITNALAINAGGGHSVAVLADGTLRAWGINSNGQIGDGTRITRTSPVQVSGIFIVTQPIFTLPTSNVYDTPQDAYIYCNTAGATIHYTTNGQEPTESSPVANSGTFVKLFQTTTLKARAFKSGWYPSKIATATYTIIPPPNPIDDSQTFVRQQYRDFLNREADADGLGYWAGQITSCGSNAQCTHDRRVGVADAFFFEDEFQKTGAYIYRVIKAATGQKPNFSQFMADRGQVVAGAGLEQSKGAYALAFVQRDSFLQTYPRTQTADQFVDALLGSIKQNSGVDLASQRAFLIAFYDGTDQGRATILKQVADTPAFIDAEYNSSFVLMEYFGYLRRDPEAGGFEFWLDKVGKFPLRDVGIQHAMACSFITSAEYQLRFGSSVTHTNQECPQ